VKKVKKSSFEHEVDYDNDEAVVGVVMGSQSDWSTMREAAEILDHFGIKWERRITSAHRTPDRMIEYARQAKGRGIKLIIAGAGRAAHLPGMVAALSRLPVHGVPVESKFQQGNDSLLSIVQMPRGVPTATFAIGPHGACNAALHVVRILATTDDRLDRQLEEFIEKQAREVGLTPLDEEEK